jgi:Negative regulator of beta-lactamase expression
MVTTSTILSPNKSTGRGSSVRLIGIHTAEAPESATTAEAVARYFLDPKVEASAHWCVDSDSRVRCVNDQDTAWTLPPVNASSVNLEMAGYANQTEVQWHDPYSLAVMENAAICVAEWCTKFNIPIVHLSDTGISQGARGIVGHVDINRVFKRSNHSDPGPNFPWEYFLGRVDKHHLVVAGSPTKPSCVAFQRAIRTPADNRWGVNTDENADALIAASAWGGNSFPYGVWFTQVVVGAISDGTWGPKSSAAHTSTVKNAQLALKSMGFDPGPADGVWGSRTHAAFEAARSACHI